MKRYNVSKAGCVLPSGKIKSQMQHDLDYGFVGHLDQLVPNIIVEDDIYGQNRRTSKLLELDLGVAKEDEVTAVQLQWWNSESQSQWYDGFIRHAYLLSSPVYIEKAKKYIDKILDTQDEDGYIGIYTSELRYKQQIESAELWAQATLFRGLLGYYELTGEQRVFDAVKKAVDLTIASYSDTEEAIFNYEQTHGLMYVDILEQMYCYTSDKKYLAFMEWLYCQLNLSSVTIGVDAYEKNIMDKSYKLKCHGVHTYEHLRLFSALAFLTKDEKYKKLLENYLAKINNCISPSGGPIGDEWISEYSADATLTGYEFCSVHELLHSYMLMLEYTGDLSYAEKIEHLYYNAAQGMRHPVESSVCYLKSDNSYAMEGGFHVERNDIPHKAGVRYKYSPTHQDAAVCCVPNATRITPYYLQASWLVSKNCLTKALYGASTFSTKINGAAITIDEISDFPFDGKIKYVITTSKPQKLDLVFRKPSYISGFTVDTNIAFTEQGDTIVFSNEWHGTTEIVIDFKFNTVEKEDGLGDFYFQYGPLVLAQPIPSKERIGKEYGIHNLRELYYTPVNKVNLNIVAIKNSLDSFKILQNSFTYQSMICSMEMKDATTGKPTNVKLVPMGGTILRKVTFKRL